MPIVISQKKYSHIPQYSSDELSLTARRKNERRLMPGAYAPTSATISIELNKAHFEIEYSVKETPSTHTCVSQGIRIVFGKFTRKVLEITVEYPGLDKLLTQLSLAASMVRKQQELVPQDSIKRNYQIAAEMLVMLRQHVEPDLTMLETTLNKELPSA